MAGAIQHEIPKLYQRGFLIPNTDGAERVFVFRRGGSSFPSNIDRSGAERYFYSSPSNSGVPTLDDEITTYESRLSILVAQLRSLRHGSLGSPDIAAEVIVHLTIRNAHLRGTFSYGLEVIAAGAVEILENESHARRLAGIDGPIITDEFRKHLAEILKDQPHLAALNIPAALLEKLLFTKVREGFSSILDQQRPVVKTILNKLADDAHIYAGEGHRKALAKTMAPDLRIKTLKTFTWQVVGVQSDLVLPDCVAVAAIANDQFHPLVLADLSDVQFILMPLTSRTLLIGSVDPKHSFNPQVFNEAAASCSHLYFLCASHTPEFVDLSGKIGMRSVAVMDVAVNQSLNQFSPSKEKLDLSPAPSENQPNTSISIPVSYIGSFDSESAQKISDALSNLLGEMLWITPLDRVDGITFADDYSAALLELDRGIPDVEPPTIQHNQKIMGIAKCPCVIRGGVIKSHIVLRGDIARTLLDENDSHRRWANSVIANQLAHAGLVQVFDETLPGILLTTVGDRLETLLQPCTYRGWTTYFASRAVATFDETSLENAQKALLVALEDAFTEIPKARLAYREHGNIDDLLDAVLPKIAFILEHAASLLGNADGLQRDPVENAANLEAKLRECELHAWLPDYRMDLTYLWDRRGHWDSYKEFLALNRHAERLLWPFSIIPILASDGECRIEIPIDIDVEALWLKKNNQKEH